MCDKYKYRGFTIYKNVSEEFGTNYFTVVNERIRDKCGNQYHAHSSSPAQIRQIVDCYLKMKNKGMYWNYGRAIRNKALRLTGQKVVCKH